MAFSTPQIADKHISWFTIMWDQDPIDKIKNVKGIERITKISDYQHMVHINPMHDVDRVSKEVLGLLKG